MRNTALLVLALAPIVAASDSQDWSNWRGPLGTGAAVAAEPPVSWSATENVLWKAPLPGHGKSTPIVHGERIYLLAAVPLRKATAEELAARKGSAEQRTPVSDQVHGFLVLALDRATGAVAWERTVAERLPIAGTHDTNGYSSSSPVTDGDGLYVSFGSYGVYALDADSGEPRWSYDLGPQRTRNGFGEGASPALHGDTLVVVADQEDDSFIVALDAKTGEQRWKRERDELTTWTTPVIVEAGGATQVIVNGTKAVRSYDLASGELLWQCSGQTANPIPTVVTDGELAVCTSGFRGSACIAVSLAARGDLKEVEGAIRWSRSGGTPYVPSPLLVDGRLYMLNGNAGLLSCLDAQSGEVLLDRVRLDLADVYASPLAAGGHIYVTGRDGSTVVLKHADELEVVSLNSIDEPIDASPVAVGDTLYLRSNSHLFALRAAK